MLLSPIVRGQDLGLMLSSSKSNQMNIIDAIHSTRFIWARPNMRAGIIHRHARTLAKNPLNPCTHASAICTLITLRYVSMFILVPLFACFEK